MKGQGGHIWDEGSVDDLAMNSNEVRPHMADHGRDVGQNEQTS
jgi:hypothetical protein